MNFTGLKSIFKREFKSYFASPLGYIFVVIFLIGTGFLTVSRDFGKFLELRQASLDSFFQFVPWVLVVLVPAVAMRLWSEERKSGTIELLFTLPVTVEASYLGKFLAGWCFLGFSLLLTAPIALVVEWLGEPDWGVIFSGYVACGLLSGAYLAIGMVFSAMTKNQVIAFILGITACILFLVLGLPQTLEIASVLPLIGGYLEQILESLSIIDHFSALTRGLVEFKTLFFFVVVTLGALAAGINVLRQTKSL